MAKIEIQYASLCDEDQNELSHDDYGCYSVNFNPKLNGRTQSLFLKIVFRIKDKTSPDLLGRFTITNLNAFDFALIGPDPVKDVKDFNLINDSYILFPVKLTNRHDVGVCGLCHISIKTVDVSKVDQPSSIDSVFFKAV